MKCTAQSVYSLCFSFSEDLGKDVEFEVVGDSPEKVGPKQAEDAAKSIANGSDDGAQPSTSTGKSPPRQRLEQVGTLMDTECKIPRLS
jgi:hypothetical protein